MEHRTQVQNEVPQSHFYRRLLELTHATPLEPLLDELLRSLVEVSGARVAYLETFDDDGVALMRGHSRSGEELATIRAGVSVGVVQRAREQRRTVCNQATLCVPFGLSGPGGVVYLQGATDFSSSDCVHAELFARQIEQRHVRQGEGAAPRSFHQATKFYQRRHVLAVLEQMQWNMAAAARTLGVARSYLYRLVDLLQLDRVETRVA